MDNIRYEVAEHIAVMTISREQALNVLNTALMNELDAALEQVEQDRGIYCLIVTGAGDRAFVAGADVLEMKDMDANEAYRFGQLGSRILSRLERLRVPVIAAINGFALGGGLELALACDIRLAARNAVFGFPEVGLGVIPGSGGTQRLPRIIGEAAAKKLLYTAQRISADEACALKLVDSVYDKTELMDRAMELAASIARQAPIAVANVKKAVNGGLYEERQNAMELESRLFAQCFATEDQKNAMNAFSKKEKFTGFQNR